MKKQKLLIVDSFSGGKLFAEIAATEFGCENFHLLSDPNLPDYYQKTFDGSFFSEKLIWHESEQENIIKKLSDLGVDAVIAGAETGVEVADKVCAALGLRGNGLDKSKGRRSKSLMHKYADLAGVRVPKQLLTNNLVEASQFVMNNLAFPVVIKPDSSAGSDGFHLVNDMVELAKAFNSLISTQNRLGLLNNNLLVQEFIQGEEFATNTVSANGKHFVTHIWHYHKRTIGSSKIYDWEEYVSSETSLGKQIASFVFDILNSLDIKYGAAHTEIMTDDKGPVLIETASRVDGMCNPKLDNEALGVNQINLSILSMIQPELVETVFQNNFKVQGHLANVSLISNIPSEKPLTKIKVNKLQELASYKDVRWFIKIGDSLKTTTDIFSSPGFIYLHGMQKEDLIGDYYKIRDIEISGELYEL